MRVVALLAIYNEERFIAGCLEHLIGQGVEVYLIDNQSTDASLTIAEQYRGRGLIDIETLPRTGGVFSLVTQLKRKEQLAATLDADWFMHVDADEIRLPLRSGMTLAQAFADVESQGFNAVNFMEFTFIPTREAPDHDHPDFQRTMRWYYPYSPRYPHRLSAWKRQTEPVELSWSGGHRVRFPDLRMYPEAFPMRHYLFLSVPHALEKFVYRRYDPVEIERLGWHRARASIDPSNIQLPAESELRTYTSDDELDASRPLTRHLLADALPLDRTSPHPALSSVSPTRRAARRAVSVISRLRSVATARLPQHDDEQFLPAPFVVGASRSGTTLLRLMLDAHPELAVPPETHFVQTVGQRCREATNQLDCFMKTVTSSNRWPDFHLDADILEARLKQRRASNLSQAVRGFYELYAEGQGKQRWGDKSPGYIMHMRTVQDLLPEARFIHLIRDGRDVTLSVKELWFGPNSVRDAAEWWVSRVTAARDQLTGLRHYLEIRYEDLVQSPEPTLRRICEFIDIPWHPAMLDYHRSASERIAELDTDVYKQGGGRVVAAEERRSVHALTSRPPDPNRIGRWRQEMSEADRADFEAIAGPMLQSLGYDLG